MPKAEITLQRASGLPLLGLKSQPSPYVIIECEKNHYPSPIFKFSQNPQWMYHFALQAEEITSFVNFYVYNNNTNGIDQLLAFGRVEFGELLTHTNSEYRLRLVNSQEEIIDSYLYFEHFDSNPKDLYLPLDDRSCLKLKLIKALEPQSELVCSYGEQSFALAKELAETVFKYDPKDDKISFTLRTGDSPKQQKLTTDILVRNITENSFFALKFYQSHRDVLIYLSASVVLNGLIPQNYNLMSVKLKDLEKSVGKKVGNFIIKLYGPLNECIFEKQEAKIYVENNSFAIIDYYEEVDTLDDLEPYCSFKIPVNSLSWEKDSLKASQTFRYYDNYKNVQTALTFNFQLQRSTELSKVMPKLYPCDNEYSQTSTVQISQLKLSNCFLYEVLKTSTVKFVHIDKYNYVRTFKIFSLKESKAEYQIETKMSLPEGGKGTLYLLCPDYCFADHELSKLDNTTVCKVQINELKDFNEGRVEFNNKFLAFAKKNSVVNICKKFNQMVHDSLCTLKTKYQMSGTVKKGYIKLLNMKCVGSFGDCDVRLRVDGTHFRANGQVNNFMLQKPFLIEIEQGKIEIKVKLQNIQNSESDEKNTVKNQQYTLHGRFEQIFGTPSKEKVYLYQLKLPQSHRLQIIYHYHEQEKRTQFFSKRQKELLFFTGNSSFKLKLIKAYVPLNTHIYTFSISRSSYTYTSMAYKTNNFKIMFEDCEESLFSVERTEQQNLIFISVYSHDDENQLTIYNGFMNVRQIMGKGQYEISLIYEKQQKMQEIYLSFSITHSLPLGLPSLKLKLTQIELNQQKQLLRSIFKYYLVIKVNGYQYEIIQCSQMEHILKVGSAVVLRNKDIVDFDLYSSYKAISKELFHKSEKELIGRGQLCWQELEETSWVVLNFVPKKENQMKLNKNALINLEQGMKFILRYETEPSKAEARQEALTLKKKQTQIDVLSGGLVKLTLNRCQPEFKTGIIVQIEIMELRLLMTAQSNFRINQTFLLKANNMEFPLNSVLTIKEKQKYYKKSVQTIVKLRGHHYKINQEIPTNIFFQDHLVCLGSVLVFSNVFTSKAQGKLTIDEIAFRGVKIDKFSIGFVENVSLPPEDTDYHIKKEGIDLKSMNWQIQTSDMMNGLQLSIQSKTTKHKSYLTFSQLNLQQYDELQIFQKQILINGQSLIFSLKAKYSCAQSKQKVEQDLLYEIVGKNNEKDIRMKYDNKKLSFFRNNVNADIPQTTKGEQITVRVPEGISVKTKSIDLILDNGEKVNISPSIVNPQDFVYFTDRKLTVRNIRLNHPELCEKVVQPLGGNQRSLKFIVDQNSDCICILQSQSKNMLKISSQNWIFNLKVHRLLSLTGKRLLHLKNTIRDEVLTKKLAILLKHSDQFRLIFDFDQEGNLKDDKEVQVEFGYNKNSQILEIYLVIDNYFSRKYQNNVNRLLRNWMELMPVSYGAIDLAELAEKKFIGVKMEPIKNNSVYLQRSINDLIVREENIYTLGGITFQKKKWGYLTITLLNNSGIFLTQQKDQAYLYYKLEIEDANRTILASQTTEARLIISQKELKFTNNVLSAFLIQKQKQTLFGLKITGFLLTSSNHCTFFEKRQDVSDFIGDKGIKEINVQIKAGQTNNLAQNSFQLSFRIENRTNLPERVDLIQNAKQINKVDALSFRDMTGIQFLQKLMGCEQISHFYECLGEIQESFIYTEDPQSQFFGYLVQYLVFDFDAKIVGTLCEIIQMTFLKAPFLIQDMQKNSSLGRIYSRFKTICKSEEQHIPEKVIKIEHNAFQSQLQHFSKNQTIDQLMNVINMQKLLLFTSQQFLKAPSTQCNEVILNIMNIIVKNSTQIRQSFGKDIEEWIDIFGFCECASEFELFLLLLKTAREHGLMLQEQILMRWIDILLQRTYRLTFVYDFWQLLSENQSKLDYYVKILEKYLKELENNSVQTSRGIKLMLPHLLDPKNHQNVQKMIKIHDQLVKTLLGYISKSEDIIILSSNIDLLVCLNDHKLLEERERGILISLIKQKTAALKDNSSKLILSGFNSKLHKNKEVKLGSKKQGKTIQNLQKLGFRTKYLITSD